MMPLPEAATNGNLCGASAIETEIAKRTDSQSSIRRERMTRRSSLTSVMTLGQFGKVGYSLFGNGE